MKSFSSLILFCFLSQIYCQIEKGGVKVAINQKLIDAFVNYIFDDLADYLYYMKLEDNGILYDLSWGIRNLDLNKFNLNFTNDGKIYIRISNAYAFFRGSIDILGEKDFEADGTFSLNGYIKPGSNKLDNGRYRPKLEIDDIDLDYDISANVSGGILGFIANLIVKGATTFCNALKPFIKPILQDLLKEMLGNIGSKLPTEIPINEKKGLYLNCDLASPIQLRNKFLELNSIAHLFNRNISDTQNSTRYPLSYLPIFNNMQNHLQLYVSEYFLNNAIYTLLKTNMKPITINSKTNIINGIFPGLSEVYGDKDVEIILKVSEISNIKLKNKFLNVNGISTISIKVNGIFNPVYECEIELLLKVELNILSGPKLSGQVKEFNSKFKKIISKSSSKVSSPVIGSALQLINELFSPILKSIVLEDFQLQFPQVIGIQFKDVTLDIKEEYFAVNYNFNQVGKASGIFGDSYRRGRSRPRPRPSEGVGRNYSGTFGGSGIERNINNSSSTEGRNSSNSSGNFGGNRSGNGRNNTNGFGGRRL